MNRVVRLTSLLVASGLVAAIGCASGGGSSGSAGLSKTLSNSPSAGSTQYKSIDEVDANSRDIIPESTLPNVPQERGIDSAGRTLDVDSLGAMLDGLGVKPQRHGDLWLMMVKATLNGTDYTYPIQASFGKNYEPLWIQCGLSPVNRQTAPAATLKALLQLGNAMGGKRFVVDNQNTLILQCPLENADVTPARMAAVLKDVFTAVKASEPYYRSLTKRSDGTNPPGTGFSSISPKQIPAMKSMLKVNPAANVAALPESAITSIGASRGVDNQSLGEMLRDMGLNPKPQALGFVVEVRAAVNGWQYIYPIEIYSKPEWSGVWVQCGIGKLGKFAQDSGFLTDCLKANWLIGQPFLVLDENDNVGLRQEIQGQTITAAKLAAGLKSYFTSLKNLEPYCRELNGQSTTPANGGGVANPFN